jgi:hypothetical protein
LGRGPNFSASPDETSKEVKKLSNQVSAFVNAANQHGDNSPEADKAYAAYCASMDAAGQKKKTRKELLGK